MNRKTLIGASALAFMLTTPALAQNNGDEIIKGVLSKEHMHMFVSVPPKLSVSDFKILFGLLCLMFYV